VLFNSKSKNSKKLYPTYVFGTYTYSSFIELYKLFYNNCKIKRIPKNLGDLLSPLALAVWIMDDGTYHNSGVRIARNSFTKKEVIFISKILKNKFDLDTSLHKNQDKYQLYFKANAMPRLKKLILPFMEPSMLYKLGLKS
jgi:ubiquinol-cytochrome c reductase cytochrome b subunit